MTDLMRPEGKALVREVTVLIDGIELAWDQPPESVEVARHDLLRLRQDVRDIETQLTVAEMAGYRRSDEWRKGALWARTSKQRRADFLAYWLRLHDPIGAVITDGLAGPSLLARFAGWLAALEAVLHAAERAVAEDSDDAYEGLADEVARARAAIGAVG